MNYFSLGRYLSLITLVFFSLQAQSKEIRAAVSTTTKKAIFDKVDKAFEKGTGIKITYVGDIKVQDANAMTKLFLDRKADVGATSSNQDQWAKSTIKVFGKHPNMDAVTRRLIGRSGMNVFANKDNGITKLSIDQIKSIFSGEVKNWKEVGGIDEPIVLVHQGLRPSTIRTFANLVLKADWIKGKLYQSGDHKDAIEYVAKTKGTIGVATSEVEVKGAIIVQAEPIGRPIYLLVHGKPSDEIESFIRFLREEGSKLGVAN